MSFIDDWLHELALWTRVRSMKLDVGHLYDLINGTGSVLASAGFLHVKAKINENTGSAVLRRFIKVVEGGQGTFTQKELNYIVNEMNVLLRDFRETGVNKGDSNFNLSKSKLSPALAKAIAAKGNKSMLNSKGLEISAQVWATTILHYVNMNGSSDVKRCLQTEDDILKYMELEGGLNKDGTVKVDVTNQFGYCGPFQFGPAAWQTGPVKFSQFKSIKDDRILSYKPIRISADRQELVRITKAQLKGGPGDLATMGPGVVEFCNNCWAQFLANDRNSATKRRFPHARNLSRFVPRTWQMLYAMHNAGATAAYVRLLGQRVNPISTAQSVKAQAVGRQAKQQFDSMA